MSPNLQNSVYYAHSTFIISGCILLPYRLKTFQSQQRIPLCKQFAGFGGSCISSDDIRALWKHFIEVTIQRSII